MTVQELLRPRYLVVADFPQWSAFVHKKDDILELRGIHFVGNGTAKSINENEIDNYPAIFRKLEWWEMREESDMPEYILIKSEPFHVTSWEESALSNWIIKGEPKDEKESELSAG